MSANQDWHSATRRKKLLARAGPNAWRVRGLGDAIRRRRTALGISQQRLAEMADMKGSAMSYTETCVYLPSLLILWRVADALGCSAADLLRDAEIVPKLGEGHER